ncbi:hypothetical protein F4814DRAFT_446034 [Daldinia grandis]|nr:hypothetical protein F4814DRAFT_446034 [Daldinia grandis]
MSSSHGKSIDQYCLTRVPSNDGPIWLEEIMGCMDIDSATDTHPWETLFIKCGALTVTSYSISIPNRAYVTHSVTMGNMQEPRMKHRDMIVDNYKAAGGDLATLKRIGVCIVTNLSAYDCIEAAEPNNPGWPELVNGNPFLEGQLKMLREYSKEFNSARIKKVTVSANGKSGISNTNLLFMATHLTHDRELCRRLRRNGLR